jgi:hypothetical protein
MNILYGGSTLELGKLFDKNDMFEAFEHMYDDHPELIGINPMYFKYINRNLKSISKYIKIFDEYNNINKLFSSLYHSENCILVTNNVGLQFLMESGYFVKWMLTIFEIFEMIRNKKQSYKELFKYITNEKIYNEFEKCIHHCKEYQNTDDLKSKPEEIEKYINDMIQQLGKKTNISEHNKLLGDLITNNIYLNKGQKKTLLKKVNYNYTNELYEIIIKDSDMDEKQKQNIHETIKKIYSGENLFVIHRYICDICDEYEKSKLCKEKINKLQIIKGKIESGKKKFIEMLEKKKLETEKKLDEIENCEIEKYSCKSNTFEKSTAEIKLTIKNLSISVILSHIEMHNNKLLYNPILINGLLMSYYYDYGRSRYTDKTVENMIDIMIDDMHEYYGNNIGKQYKIDPIVKNIKNINYDKDFITVESPIQLHSDFIITNFKKNGEKISYTSCGETAILNLMKIFKKYNIIPNNKEIVDILKISDPDIQVNKFSKIISNLENITYQKETNDGFKYNIYTGINNIISCLDYLYTGTFKKHVNFGIFLEEIGITKHPDYRSFDVKKYKDIISITFDFGNVNLKSNEYHSQIWFSEAGKITNLIIIVDTFTSMIELFNNVASLNYISVYPLILTTLYDLTILYKYDIPINFNEEMAYVLINKTCNNIVQLKQSLEIIRKYKYVGYSIKLTNKIPFVTNKSQFSFILNNIYDCLEFNAFHFNLILKYEDINLIENILNHAEKTQQQIFDSKTLETGFYIKDEKIIKLLLISKISGLSMNSEILFDILDLGNNEIIHMIFDILLNHIDDELDITWILYDATILNSILLSNIRQNIIDLIKIEESMEYGVLYNEKTIAYAIKTESYDIVKMIIDIEQESEQGIIFEKDTYEMAYDTDDENIINEVFTKCQK